MAILGQCSLCMLVVIVLVQVSGSKLGIKNGGFEDFVIAVNKDVRYTPDIVGHLQTLVQDTSDRLYEKTGLFIHSVSILVPSMWPREQTWKKTDKLTFSEADLRVDKPHPYYRNIPYTQPTWQCGQMQNYIHITPDFVQKKYFSQNEGFVLANQFSSYRWGVFEDIIRPNMDDDSMSKTQEKVCNGRTAWDVIKSHPDYQQSGQNKTSIFFAVVYNENDVSKAPDEKECGRPVVLVLDFSVSMSEKDRAFRQQQASNKFIQEILPLSTELGIIAFAKSPKRLSNVLVKLRDRSTKDQMAAKIGLKEDGIGGSTDIGAALEAAYRMLVERGHPLEESRIVLLTDGEENPIGQIARVMPRLVDSKIKVHSIAVGDQAAADLGVLCQQTGGQLGKYVENKNSASLTQAVDNLWSDFNMLCVENKPIEIDNKALLLGKDKPEIEERVAIDTSIKDAEFTFTPEKGNIEVTVTSPDQTTYDDKSPEYREEPSTHVIKFNFKNMEPGEWKSKVMSKSLSSASSDKKEQVIMNIKAKAKEETQSYEVRSWLNSVIVQIPAVTRIYAEVTQGYAPLIKAKVTASIEVPGGGTITVELKDDGIWPDVRALDGTYTAEFQSSSTEDQKKSAAGSSSSERYSVDITVTPVKGQTAVVHKLVKEEGGLNEEWTKNGFDVEITEEDIVTKPAEPFHRKTSPGVFEIKNVTYGIDLYPPARVVDLRMIRMEGHTVTLEWTAPGDDLMNGTAAEYEFWLWYNETELRKNLTNGLPVKQDFIVQGTLTPSLSGSREVLRFKLPEYWPTSNVFIAMVSRDAASKQSDVSNIVKVLHPGPVYGIMSDPSKLFVYIFSTVYFVTRLIEVMSVGH